jgi:MFS family permease
MPLKPVWRACPTGFIATLLVGISFGAVLGLTAAYGQHRGLDAAGTSLFVAAFIIGGALTQYLAGFLSDRFGRLSVLFAFTLLATLGAAALLYVRGDAQLYMAALAFGAFALPIYALGVAQVQDHVPERARVAASGGLLILNGFGSFIGPLLIAALSVPFGPAALFIVLGAAHGLLALAVVVGARLPSARAAN